jgi:hypothetical protein
MMKQLRYRIGLKLIWWAICHPLARPFLMPLYKVLLPEASPWPSDEPK